MTSLNNPLAALKSVLTPSTGHATARPPRGAILELRLPHGWPARHPTVHWCLRRQGAIQQTGVADDLAGLTSVAKDAAIMVWSPAADTLLTTASLPTRNRNKILQALPYALEEQLLDDPEAQHYVHQAESKQRLAVAVTRRAQLRLWLDALNGAELRPTGLCPSTLALPYSHDAWALAFEGDEIWVRTGQYSGFACPASPQPPIALLAALKAIRETDNAPTTLLVFNPPADFTRETWADALGLQLIIEHQDLWESQSAAAPPFNLLQREFAPTTRRKSTALQQLRPAAALLAIWLLSSVIATLWEWRQLTVAQTNIQNEMIQLFRSSFPDTKAIVDPALQMQRNLADLKTQSGKLSDNDCLPLLSRMAPTIRAQTGIALQNIKYSDDGMTMGLTLPDFKSLESLKNSLTVNGLTVEVVSANSRGDSVAGRLRIHGASKSGG